MYYDFQYTDYSPTNAVPASPTTIAAATAAGRGFAQVPSPDERVENDKKFLCKKYIEQGVISREQFALYDYIPDAQQQPPVPQQQVPPKTKKLKASRKDTVRYSQLDKLQSCFILQVPLFRNSNKLSFFIHEKACAEFLISMPKEGKTNKEPILSLPRKLKYHCSLVRRMSEDLQVQALWDATTEDLLTSLTTTDESMLLLLSKLWKGGEVDVHSNEKITTNLISRIIGQPVHQLYEENEQAVALLSVDAAFNHITSGGCFTVRTSKQAGHFVIVWRNVLGVKGAVQSRVCVSRCPHTGGFRVRYCPFNIDLQIAKTHPQLVQWYPFDKFFTDALRMEDMFFMPKYEAMQHATLPIQLQQQHQQQQPQINIQF